MRYQNSNYRKVKEGKRYLSILSCFKIKSEESSVWWLLDAVYIVIYFNSFSMFTCQQNNNHRKVKGQSQSSRISEGTPSFCTVYAVSRGKLSSVRPSNLEKSASIKDDSSDASSTTSSSHTSSSPAGVYSSQFI